MKSKLLLSAIFIFCAITSNYAQSSATQSGISVQGIARDATNTAVISKAISLKCTLYYLDSSNIEQLITNPETLNLITDEFGVFSAIIDVPAANRNMFAYNSAYLKIEMGTTLISNEKLQYVPYAIMANNGVPPGSIMPYIGAAAPDGWALCDGAPLPANAKVLIAMVGSNAPDLRGFFLRGAGTNTVTGYTSNVGPNLKTPQAEAVKAHNHSASVTDPGHTHTYGDVYQTEKKGNTNAGKTPTVTTPDDIGTNSGVDKDNAGYEMSRNSESSKTGISVSIANNTGTETRPINYGVNYIIKL